jgi:DNA repair ATPase RecN
LRAALVATAERLTQDRRDTATRLSTQVNAELPPLGQAGGSIDVDI